MLAISPQFCSYEQEKMSYFCRERMESIALPVENGEVKKLYHNASERDRRNKMNSLYAKLRSLLPPDEHSKKLSIPATISRAMKYIPELRKEVERLTHKKEISMAASLEFKNHKQKPIQPNSNSAVSATRINDSEVVIQISMPKSEKTPLSEAISRLEEQGFLMVNASCFESFGGRLFYNLHFQAQQGQVIDAEKLKEKAWPLI